MRRAFTLVELLITVIVIAVLVSIAIPTYIVTMERAKEREARATLEAMRAAELSYASERRTFLPLTAGSDDEWQAIGLENPNNNANAAWTYEFTAPTGTATRSAPSPNSGETITLDQDGTVGGDWDPSS